MTKETKIGLLVGLAFIILFAIILSEKGPGQRGAGATQFTVVDSSARNSPPSTAGQPLHNAGKLPVDSQLPPIVKAGSKSLPAAPLREEQIAQAPMEDEPLQPLPDSLASLIKSRTETPAQTSEPVGPSISKPEPASTPGPILARIPEPKTLTEEPATTAAPESKEEPTTTALQTPVDDGPKIIWTVLAEHTVQPGESLGKIAAKYYGRSTPARVDALYKMNKDTMPSVSSVKAGHKLRIPNLGEHSDKFEPASPFSGSFASNVKPAGSTDSPVRIPEPIVESTPKSVAKDKSPTIITASKKESPAEIKFELYEIRKGDTLSKIARRELGSEKYAKDLQRLNKIGEKQNLKPGTKIRLPARQTAQGESATLSARASELSEP